MSIASSVARSVVRPVARAVTLISYGSALADWTPEQLSTLRQWLSDNYYSSPVGGLQVIESLEPHGTVRAPQPGCCALFDGTNDKGVTAARISPVGDFTFSCWIEPNSVSGVRCVATEYLGTTNTAFYLGTDNAFFEVYFYTSVNDYSGKRFATAISLNTKLHVLVTLSGTTISVYLNGVLASPTTSPSNGTFTGMSATSTRYLEIGGIGSGNYFDGKIWDVRAYSVAKTAPEVAAIAACDFTNLDTTGIVAGWYLNERAGTTARDWTGNGHDLTLSGPITEATFWAEDSSVTVNPFNVLGGTISGSTVIPRDESDITKDVQGNALQYTGLSPYPVTIDTPCVTLDGTNDYINLGDVSTSPTTISVVVKLASDDQDIMTLQNSTATAVTVVAGVLTFGGSLTVSAISVDGAVVSAAAAGALLNDNEWHTLLLTLTAISCSALRIGTDGSGFGNISICELELTASGATKTFPLQEGQGTAADNVKVYWYKTDGTYGSVASALVGVTVASAWASRCPGYVRDHAFEHGGRLDALGAFCPLVPGTALCADGNAATIAAGNIAGNPYSRVDFDPFDAAELGALNVPGEFDSLPCVTGNGTNNYIDFGSALIANGATSFVIEEHIRLDTLTAGFIAYRRGNTTNGIEAWFYTDGVLYLDWYVGGVVTGQTLALAGIVAAGEWAKWTFDYDGSRAAASRMKVYVNDVEKTLTVASNAPATIPTITGNLEVFRSVVDSPTLGRVSSITIGTKHFPLTDVSGADIAMYEAGVATIITNAIQGTLTNVWSNNTDGQVDHTFPEAVRAIVPRDTKFTNGSTKTITTSEPATGADLTNILGYIG